ncbi:unnamed protein product [Closterium sp. NIES-53]
MEVARTSMIHAAAPHFLWPFAVRYAAHQLNLLPRVSLPETSPTLRWTGEVGDALVFRVWGSRAFVRDTSAYKLSARAIPCVFLGFVPDAPGWQLYHPTSRRVLPSQDVTFDESVPFYLLFPYRSAPPPPSPFFLAPGAAPGAAAGGAESEGAESGGAEPRGAASSGGPAAGGVGDTGAGGAGVTAGAGGTGGTASTGPGGARTRVLELPRLVVLGALELETLQSLELIELEAPALVELALEALELEELELLTLALELQPPLQPASPLHAPSPYTEQSGGLTERREAASRPVLPVRTARRVPCSRPPPVSGTHAMALRPSSVPLHVPQPAPPEYSLPEPRLLPLVTRPPPLGPQAASLAACLPPPSLVPALSLRCPVSARPACCAAMASLHVLVFYHEGRPIQFDTWLEDLQLYLQSDSRDSVSLFDHTSGAAPAPPATADSATRSQWLTRDTASRLAIRNHLPLAECAHFGQHRTAQALYDVVVARYFLRCCSKPSSTALPISRAVRFCHSRGPGTTVALNPTALTIDLLDQHLLTAKTSVVAIGAARGTPCTPFFEGCSPSPLAPSYAAADIPGGEDVRAASASAKRSSSKGLAIPDPESDLARAASPTVSRLLATVVTYPSFESTVASALVAELVDFAAACRLDYATTLVAESEFASPPSVGVECALGTDVLEDTQEDFKCLAAAVPRFASMLLALEGDPDAPDIPTPRSYAEAITVPYSSHWQAAMDAEMASWKSTGTFVDEVPPPGANIVDGMWIFRVKRPPGSLPAFKARYVARGFSAAILASFSASASSSPRHGPLLYVPATHSQLHLRTSPTSGIGLVLRGRGPVVLTGHADASWVDDSATQRSSQGYTFSPGSGSVSWRSTRLSSFLSSSCEAEIYAGAMAAQELRWLTYLLIDLGEQPRLPPVLYVDNKAMIAMCQEHRLEHRTKHIARELQQCGQLCLAYVAIRANTADIFTKALLPACLAFLDWSCDHLFSPTLPMGVC